MSLQNSKAARALVRFVQERQRGEEDPRGRQKRVAKEEDEELAVIEPDRVDDPGAKVVPADHHRCAMQARQWAGAWAFVSKKARL